MRQFNLEEAKAGKPVQTKRGDAVRILCFDRKYSFPLLGLIDDPSVEGLEKVICFTEAGIANTGFASDDLEMKPDVQERWINLYWDDEMLAYCPGAVTFASEAEAKTGISPFKNHVATVKVEWEN